MRQLRLVAVMSFLSLVVMFAGAGAALCDEVPAKQPKLEATPQNFDFGTVKEGEKPTARFTIKNAGNAELIIYEAKPSCGCTVANISSKNLKPGETATIEAVYNSQNANGQVHKSVNVRSNDPKTPSVSLGITGTVKAEPQPDVMLDAYNAINLRIAPGRTETRQIKVSNPGQLDLDITEMTSSQGISAKMDKFVSEPGKTVSSNIVIRPGETRLLDITIAPKTSKGNFQEVVTIRTNSKRRPAVSFVANGVVGE